VQVRPVIKYCATPAGRIAYSAAGSGPALLCDPGWVSHVRRQLDLFSFGRFVAGLAERFTVIRYDKPGCGLSDREVTDLSFDTQIAAALAVVDAAGADRFRLFGASQGGQLAAAIAARHPERVEALVLYGTCADGSDLAPAEVRKSIVALIRAHWGLGSKMLTGIFISEPTAEEVDALTWFQRESAWAAVASGLLEMYYGTDVRPLAEAHVENIRRKLGVRSRAQIAAWVTEQRLGDGAPR
jgi:pimeloyl-ACP methyl ester carboxylesterase